MNTENRSSAARVEPVVMPPCPYCGSGKHPRQPVVSIIQWPRQSGKYRWCVTCCVCGAHGPIMPTEQEAVDVFIRGKYEEAVKWDHLPESA